MLSGGIHPEIIEKNPGNSRLEYCFYVPGISRIFLQDPAAFPHLSRRSCEIRWQERSTWVRFKTSSILASTLQELIATRIIITIVHPDAAADPSILDPVRTKEYATTTRFEDKALIAINPMIFDNETTGKHFTIIELPNKNKDEFRKLTIFCFICFSSWNPYFSLITYFIFGYLGQSDAAVNDRILNFQAVYDNY